MTLMNRLHENIFLPALMALACASAQGEVKLPSLIADNMVLQQQTDARLWGTARPDKEVTVAVSWDTTPVKTKAGKDGTWLVSVPTPGATSEPQHISFTDPDGSVTISDVLIGEVWFCAGQSNMEMPVRGFDRQPVEGSLDAILDARPSRPIRMYRVDNRLSSSPLAECSGEWRKNTPEGVAACSATAYFFADYLNRQLDVPVAVITAHIGGTRVQPWMSRESAVACGLDVQHLDTAVNLKTREVHQLPAMIYNGMVAPATNFTVKGMLWYQGESNSSDPDLYDRLMPVFVADMREKFGLGEIPFYYVQVAPYARYGGKELEGIASLRVAQARMMDKVPNCGMAVTLDIGDPDCIHPARKKEVGQRLALWALAKTYNANPFAWSGPIFDHMEYQDPKKERPARPDKVYLYFNNTGGGVAPLERPLDGFEAAGPDGVWHPAEAIVEGGPGLLAVTCPAAGKIEKVRYGYRPYFEATLFDNFGLPASPFITDGALR